MAQDTNQAGIRKRNPPLRCQFGRPLWPPALAARFGQPPQPITLVPGPGYMLETNLSATATLEDDDATRVPATALAQAVAVARNRSAALLLTGSDLENDPLSFEIVTPRQCAQ